jgi:hypothetical protein
MNEELNLLKDIALRLDSAGIEYMMTGSMAMAIYSTPRMTRDIDMIIKVCPVDVEKIISLFRADFYLDEDCIKLAVQEKGMFNIIHNESVIKVDFIICKDEEYRIVEFSRRHAVNIEGVPVSVVSVEDLILSKLIWSKRSGSELQFRDVRQMMMASKDIDSKYIECWSEILGVGDLLRKAGEHV